MPRKGYIAKREILPDPKFSDKVVAKLINKLTSDGKKSKAESILYGALDVIEAPDTLSTTSLLREMPAASSIPSWLASP